MTKDTFPILFALFCSFVAISAGAYTLWLERVPQNWWYAQKRKWHNWKLIRFYKKEFLRLEQLAIELAGTESFHSDFEPSGEFYTLPDPYPKNFGLWLAFCRNLCYDSADWREKGATTEEIRDRLRQRIANRDRNMQTLNSELEEFNTNISQKDFLKNFEDQLDNSSMLNK